MTDVGESSSAQANGRVRDSERVRKRVETNIEFLERQKVLNVYFNIIVRNELSCNATRYVQTYPSNTRS